jgi:drug/metabolite transporter (DMT)-like permease
MSYALSYAPSSTLAPLHYLEIVSAVALGYLVFGDLPNRVAVLGMIIIIGSGLYVIYREQKVARAAQL